MSTSPYDSAKPFENIAGASLSRQLIFCFLVILAAEDPVRKWLLPAFSAELYILKYLFLSFIYAVAFNTLNWPRTNSLLYFYYILAIGAMFVLYWQLLLHYNFDLRYLWFGLYGLANNFLFLPLAFLIPRLLDGRDVRLFSKWIVIFALCSAPIVYLQFYAPVTAPINSGFAVGNTTVFHTLAGGAGLVRPEGMFTSNIAQAIFVALTFAITLAAIIEGRGLLPIWLTLSGLVAATVMALFGGNRTELSEIAVVMLFGLLFMARRRSKRDFIFLFLAPAALVAMGALIALADPDSVNALVDRWTAANASDTESFQGGFFGRSLYAFYAFIEYVPVTPVYGYLVGICNDAIDSATWFVLPPADLNWHGFGQWGREGGFAVHIVELGPILGMAYIFLRIYTFAWIFSQCYRHYKSSRDIFPLMLFSVGGLALIYLPIVTNGDVGAFCWTILGFSLAATQDVRTDALPRPKAKASAKAEAI